jgi:hypothetical protein
MTISLSEVQVAGLGVLVAGLSAVVGWLSHKASLKQYRLSASTAAADWLRDLRSWASEAIDVLAEATYHLPKADSGTTVQQDVALRTFRARLSALIDRGRLFLPNEKADVVGTHKAQAYRGWRHPVLNPLIAAERILGNDISLRSFPSRKAALIGVRREFASSVQAILDPQSYNAKIGDLLRIAAESRKKDPTIGGLLPSPESVPVGAEGLMELASRRYERQKAQGKHSS